MSVYFPETATVAELAMPDFDKAEKVHDWRNHVGTETRRLWDTFTAEQQRAIAIDANELAGNELWE